MKLSRDVSATELIHKLAKIGYLPTRQKGSHIRISRNSELRIHHVTIPNHSPLKVGTLSSILNSISRELQISKQELLERLD